MKKILSLILVCIFLLTACLGLVSCGDTTTDDPNVTTDTGSTPDDGGEEVSNFPIPDDVLEGHTPTEAKFFKFKVDKDKGTAKLSGFYTDIPSDIVVPAEVEIDGQKYKVTELGDSAFAQASIKTVYVPYTVTKIGKYAFSGCPNLESVSIPTTITKLDAGIFANNESLVTIDFIPESVTSIGERAFEGCKGLTSVTLPNSVKKIGAFAFVDCGYIDTVVLPATITEIPNDCFNGCQYLNNVVLPDTVKVIGKNAFKGCKRMTNFNMGNGVEIIGDSAFADCTNMTKFVFADSVKSIGTTVFDGNRKLATVKFPTNAELVIADKMFAADTSKFKLSKLYCAPGSAAETWLKNNGYGEKVLDVATFEG